MHWLLGIFSQCIFSVAVWCIYGFTNFVHIPVPGDWFCCGTSLGPDYWDYHVMEDLLSKFTRVDLSICLWLHNCNEGLMKQYDDPFAEQALKQLLYASIHNHPSIFHWPFHVDDVCESLLIYCTLEHRMAYYFVIFSQMNVTVELLVSNAVACICGIWNHWACWESGEYSHVLWDSIVILFIYLLFSFSHLDNCKSFFFLADCRPEQWAKLEEWSTGLFNAKTCGKLPNS